MPGSSDIITGLDYKLFIYLWEKKENNLDCGITQKGYPDKIVIISIIFTLINGTAYI